MRRADLDLNRVRSNLENELNLAYRKAEKFEYRQQDARKLETRVKRAISYIARENERGRALDGKYTNTEIKYAGNELIKRARELVEKSKKPPLEDVWKKYLSEEIPLGAFIAVAKRYYIGSLEWKGRGESAKITVQYGDSKAKAINKKSMQKPGSRELYRAINAFNALMGIHNKKENTEIHFSAEASTKHHPEGLVKAGFTNYKIRGKEKIGA